MSESHQREAAIFDAAMELPAGQRAAHLDHACGGDAALRQRMESLLNACESKCEFLDSPMDPAAAKTMNALPFEKAGDRIGRYKLLQQIGEGGCGVVYMAEQEEPVSRRVALKVIKLGLDTKSVIARFEAERQALALMDHPNIAKVLDAGATETGRPYFVMELVRGLKITEYCDEARLSTHARLDLFIQVCQAIQHAHQKGIIHRDIKPSNILVTINDGVPVPKVIDFGIAKATGGLKLTNKTVFTAFEQFIGTPAYMSPEQAVLTSLDIDTRSDIYALGVLLYEMLTGRTPFDAKELLAIGLDEMRRTIRETEPPRPSTRVSTLAQNELSTTAQRRGIEAPKLASELRGDLDWIVMKALEKDRARRYETANGLAMDIQRHLNDEPVVACPPSRFYRLQKMVRRNKLAFAAGSAVVASLVIGTTLSTVSFFRAAEQAAIAQAVNDFLQDDLLRQASSYSQANAHFTPDPNLTVRQALDRAAERISDRFKNRPLQEAAIKWTIGVALTDVGESERAVAHLQRALELRRAKLGPNHRDTLTSMHSLATAYESAGKLDQALPLLEETLKLQKTTLGRDHTNTLRSMNSLGNLYRTVGKRDQSLALRGEMLKLAKARLGPGDSLTLVATCNLALSYLELGKVDQAVSLLEETLKPLKATLETGHPVIPTAMENLASAYRAAGKLDKAISVAEEALRLRKASQGPDNPETLGTMMVLGNIYGEARKFDQAVPLLEETLKLTKTKLAPDHPLTLNVMANLGTVYSQAGNTDKALPLLEEALKLTRTKTAYDLPDTLVPAMNNLAIAYRRGGKTELALPLMEEALNLQKTKRGADHPETWKAMWNLAVAYKAAGKFDQAVLVREEMLELVRAKNGPDSQQTWGAMADLAIAYGAAGKFDKALPLFEETVKLRKARLGPDHSDTLASMNELAWILATSRDSAIRNGSNALSYAEQAVEGTKRKDPEFLDTLAAAYAEAGEFAKAADVQREAIGLCQDEKTKNDLTTRLKLYESNTPFRE
ncbi:MAG: tetratricopeptide repeat protein [Verrucomicrobia bacterium]|nr:tetratricopeptide repeat protein [Verrucomicrobiota bacterium]